MNVNAVPETGRPDVKPGGQKIPNYPGVIPPPPPNTGATIVRSGGQKGSIPGGILPPHPNPVEEVHWSLQYEQLKNAVCDLLAELRIDERCLEVMARGYSPDYPGAIDLAVDESWKNPKCKIQLSMIVASKLFQAGII